MDRKRKYVKWTQEEKGKIKEECIRIIIREGKKTVVFKKMIEEAQKVLPRARHRSINKPGEVPWLILDEIEIDEKQTKEDTSTDLTENFEEQIQTIMKKIIEDAFETLISALELDILARIEKLEDKIIKSGKEISKITALIENIHTNNKPERKREKPEPLEEKYNNRLKRVMVFGLPQKHHGHLNKKYGEQIDLTLLEPPNQRGSKSKQIQ